MGKRFYLNLMACLLVVLFVCLFSTLCYCNDIGMTEEKHAYVHETYDHIIDVAKKHDLLIIYCTDVLETGSRDLANQAHQTYLSIMHAIGYLTSYAIGTADTGLDDVKRQVMLMNENLEILTEMVAKERVKNKA